MSILSKGTTFGYCSTKNGTFTDVANIVSMSFPEVAADVIERKAYVQSVNYPQKLFGWNKVTDLEVELELDKTSYATLFGMLTTAQFFQITYGGEIGTSTKSKHVLTGAIAKIGGTIPAGPGSDIVTTKLTIAQTDAPTFTAGT